ARDVVRVDDVVEDLFGVEPGDHPPGALVAEVDAEPAGRRHVVHDGRHQVGQRLRQARDQRLVTLGQDLDRGTEQVADASGPAAGGVHDDIAVETAARGPDGAPATDARLEPEDLRVLEDAPAGVGDDAGEGGAVAVPVDVAVARTE